MSPSGASKIQWQQRGPVCGGIKRNDDSEIPLGNFSQSACPVGVEGNANFSHDLNRHRIEACWR